MKATMAQLETLVTKINTVLRHDNTWTMQTALTAFIEQVEKFENVFVQFEDETFNIENVYDFTVEGIEEYPITFSIFQMYEDLKILSIEW